MLRRSTSKDSLSFFTNQLKVWFSQSHRPLPWKGEKDAYLIWLSEIILQQTRVEQGLPYFERFRERFPTVHDLANAPEDTIMKTWEGLGYYSRARNLHAAAKYIVHTLKGKFPSTYEGIRALKGVGPYTAAAIASFAYELPYAVVDGNVFRVLSRFWGIQTPIDSTEGKKQFANLADRALQASSLAPSQHNQAMMDFGATHCKPKAPLCSHCPLNGQCAAFQNKKVDQLPVKSKKIKKKNRYFHYLVVNAGPQVMLRKRTEKDIWRNLYEFPVLEWPEAKASEQEIRRSAPWEACIGDRPARIEQISPPQQQTLTHQKIQAVFWEIHLEDEPPSISELAPYILADRKNLSNFAFPKIIDWYLGDNSLYLKLV
ncbi:A/G-specific adenine glycosylase [Phaeodactylibacter xiamenensis]|jgi:A/G-specific adenine glycosylase|uniref:A/G-specific adenine glycosylase n=1 Tax=Phaeodactylibacter xiamenensis TaxID=1524460 RepID=UPI0024A9E273|nr:A/G-specific adenine glycosylase [Phaeodactylibacter xiamenensis]